MCDDAAVFPPGNAELPGAVAAHRRHRAARYAPLVGPLLVPASRLAEAAAQLGPDEVLKIGVIADGAGRPARRAGDTPARGRPAGCPPGGGAGGDAGAGPAARPAGGPGG